VTTQILDPLEKTGFFCKSLHSALCAFAATAPIAEINTATTARASKFIRMIVSLWKESLGAATPWQALRCDTFATDTTFIR
jgi:hypothetical protein